VTFLRRRVWDPLVALLKQGTSPEKLSLSIALGAVLGIFPILGATTFLCFCAGVLLRLNHAALQLVNYLVYPLQIPLILLFVRLGERLVGAPPTSFSPLALAGEFREAPSAFLMKFGWTGLRGILAWTVVAPVAGIVIYFGTLPALRRAAKLLRPEC